FPCYAEGTLLLCRFGTPRHLICTKNSVNSFVSPSPRASFAKGTSTHSPKSFVSPTYAKTGGGGCLIRELSVTSDQRSGGETKADPSRKMIFAAEFLCHSSSGDFNRLENL